MPPSSNLTHGPVARTLIVFALPILASNILQTLNGSLNAIWVSRLIGEDALAATSVANTIMVLLFSTVFGFGMAATVLVAQAMGRHDVAAARRAFASATGLCVLLSLAVASCGMAFTDSILRLLATPDSIFALSATYLRIIFLALPGLLLLVVTMMSLRGAGDAMTPLRFMGLAVLLDAGLNPVFILGLGPIPAMGIAGSALATAIANYASLAALLAYMRWRDLPLALRGREVLWLYPRWETARILIGKGVPMCVQMMLFSGAGVVLIGLANREGTATTAAYGACLQIWNYLQMPAMAIGAAVTTMVAQNLGARQWDRVGRAVRSGVAFHLALTSLSIACVLAFSEFVLGLFLKSDGAVLALGAHIQWLAIWTYLPFGITVVLFGALRANGAVIAPLLVLGVTLFPIRLGVYFLGYPAIGADALWLSMPVSAAFSVIAASGLYLSGGWRARSFGFSPQE